MTSASIMVLVLPAFLASISEMRGTHEVHSATSNDQQETYNLIWTPNHVIRSSDFAWRLVPVLNLKPPVQKPSTLCSIWQCCNVQCNL